MSEDDLHRVVQSGALDCVKTRLVRPGFPRVWALLGFLLGRRDRERIYEPAHNELLEDYVVAKRSYRTPWARRWLTFCFTLRTVLLLAACVRALLGGKVCTFLMTFLPARLKEWWQTGPH